MAHWGKIFQKDFEKFSKKKGNPTLRQLLQSKVKQTEAEIRDSASALVTPHWGKFFYLQDARHPTLGQIFLSSRS
jgi:hypothetical protein